MTIERDVNIEGVYEILHFHEIFFVTITETLQEEYLFLLRKIEKYALEFQEDVTSFYNEVQEKSLKFFTVSVIDRIIEIERKKEELAELQDEYYYEYFMERNIYTEVKKLYKVKSIHWTAKKYEEIVVLNRKITKIYSETLITLERLFDIIYKK